VLITSPTLSNSVATFSFNHAQRAELHPSSGTGCEPDQLGVPHHIAGNGSLMEFAVPVAEATQRFFACANRDEGRRKEEGGMKTGSAPCPPRAGVHPFQLASAIWLAQWDERESMPS